RHLYILMMLLKDSTTNITVDGEGTPAGNDPVETARAIAKWAVNVIDFRDRDSIMTPFEYTIYPFRDGWTADGDINATDPLKEAVVWGCERPELLITESLAFHDRRTEDLKTDDSGKPTGHTFYNYMPTTPPNKDDDFEQRLVPLGSFFVELYNPWTTPY